MEPMKKLDEVDWKWYADHKEEIDEEVKATLERGDLQNMGHPPGPTLEITARAICTIIHKNPKKARLTALNKPLTASEIRKQKRFERDRVPDKIIDYELKEGEGFKIIPNEDYIQPPSVPYVKDGKQMPEGWEPIKFESSGPLKKLEPQSNEQASPESSDRTEVPAES